MLNLAELHKTEAELAEEPGDKKRSVEKRRSERWVRSPEAPALVPSEPSPAVRIRPWQLHLTEEQLSAKREELAVVPAELELPVEQPRPRDRVQASDQEAEPVEFAGQEAGPSEEEEELSEEREPLTRARSLYSESFDVLERVFAVAAAKEELPVAEIELVARRLIEHILSQSSDLPHLAMVYFGEGKDFVPVHSINVAILGTRVGHALKLGEDALEQLCLAALLHDLGSARVQRDLPKSGSPTSVEREEVDKWPIYGREILAEQGGPALAGDAEVVYQACERWDGSGYPRGLQGNGIFLQAQIVGVVDTYEALTHWGSDMPAPVSPRSAMQTLLERKGVEFRQEVVKALTGAVGLFPAGSYVKLSNGEVGRVLESRATNLLRPMVAVQLDARNQPLEQVKQVDLMQERHLFVVGSLTVEDIAELEMKPESSRYRSKVVRGSF